MASDPEDMTLDSEDGVVCNSAQPRIWDVLFIHVTCKQKPGSLSGRKGYLLFDSALNNL